MASTEGCSLALPFMEDARPAVDLAAIVEAYSTLLFRIANSVLRSRSEAEDVVQDVFLRVVQHRHSLSTVRDMRVWLVRIAWNLALDRKRRKRPEQLDESFRQIAGQRNYAGGCGDGGGTALSFRSAGNGEIAQGGAPRIAALRDRGVEHGRDCRRTGAKRVRSAGPAFKSESATTRPAFRGAH